MMPGMPPVARRARPAARAFDVDAFLTGPRVSTCGRRLSSGAVLFAQGDPATSVCYIRHGNVKLSVVSSAGKERVVGMLGPGDFVGEGCLTGQPLRMCTAAAVAPTEMLVLRRARMARLLHDHPAFSERFISYMLARNIRIEEDLVDQLFNSSEKRLARVLLLLARYGRESRDQRVLPRLSQESLAEMVGTTRSRVNFFMNKFRKLGFIDYNGVITVHTALLSVVLHD